MTALESMEQSLRKIKAAETAGSGEGHWTDAVVLLSDVIQSCFGFVTGCAWSDWLFENVTVLNANPTVPVIFTNLAIVCLITLFSCYWLIMNTSSEGLEENVAMTEEQKKAKAEAKAVDRNEVEKQFFSGALGFFVLGGWLVVVRNLFAPFMVLIESGIALSKSELGVHLPHPKKTGDTVAVLLFAPAFTVLSFTVANRVMTSFAKKANVEDVPKGKAAAQTEEASKRTEIKRRISADGPVSIVEATARPPTTSLLVALLTCKGERAKELLVYKLEHGGVKTVVDFLESAAVFALSKMWWDLISAFIFHLHAVPYCGGFVATECYEEASASTQFIYAALSIPVAGLLKHLAESSGLTERPGMYGEIALR